jgi:hypothetical protein
MVDVNVDSRLFRRKIHVEENPRWNGVRSRARQNPATGKEFRLLILSRLNRVCFDPRVLRKPALVVAFDRYR